jgi:hypothetical protein
VVCVFLSSPGFFVILWDFGMSRFM